MKPAIVFVGHPELWPEFESRFSVLLAVLPRLEHAFNGLVTRGYDSVEPWQQAVLNLGMLNEVQMKELCTLAANGLGHGAMKILRGMLETSVNAEYIRRFPHEFRDFADWRHVEIYRHYEHARRHIPSVWEEIGHEERVRAKADYDRVKERFLTPGRRPNGQRLRSRWCRYNLAQEAEKAGLASLYENINQFASQILHGTSLGLLFHFDVKEDTERIAVPPSMRWCPQALCGYVWFGIDPDPPLGILEADFATVWGSTR